MGFFRSVVANILDCYIGESEFKRQSRYYIHFPSNTLEKMYKSPYPSNNGWDS